MTEKTEDLIAEAMVNAGAPLMHSRVEEGVASALRAANMLRESAVPDAALEAAEAERDAALAAIERILAPSIMQDTHKRVDGYALGTPDGYAMREGDTPEIRPRRVLDDLIEDAIGRLPSATRLYPEVYAWRVSEAIVAALDGAPEPEVKP